MRKEVFFYEKDTFLNGSSNARHAEKCRDRSRGKIDL
jgi:hypothetical protein